jgi:membrane-bound inhibitor of C-type lysozyme
MKKQNLQTSIVIIIAFLALGFFLMQRKVQAPAAPVLSTTQATGKKTFDLACDNNRSLSVTFHVPSDDAIDVAFDDGRSVTLPNISTADAIAYANADKSVMLTLTGADVSITEGGNVTYANCTTPDSSGTKAK